MAAAPVLTRRIMASPLLALILACVACLVPFANKAFHIDDTLFLYAARQIQNDPVNFYNFWVNWYGTNLPMWETMQNPPLASYYIALAASLFGESEVALHLAFLLPAVAAVWGTYRLAEQLCTRPVLAALATLLTPAFLVSSTNVMCDTLTLCFWIWAVVFWERGLRRRQTLLLYVSAVLICCTALTKYIGVALIPLLLAYTLAYPWGRGNRLTAVLTYSHAMVVPLLVLWFYQWATAAMYGHGLLFQAAGYAASIRDSWNAFFDAFFMESLVTLCFIGGSVATLLFYLPLLWSWRVLSFGLALTAVTFLALALGLAWSPTLSKNMSFGQSAGTIPWLGVGQFALFAVAGFGLMALAALDLWTRRDAASLLLALWVVGIFVFATFLNWTVNVRSILPMLPAASILIARRLDERFPQPGQVRDLPMASMPAEERVEERFTAPGKIAEQGSARRLRAQRVEERFASPKRIANQGAPPSIRAEHFDNGIERPRQIASGWLALPLVPAAALALLVTWADCQMAGAARSAAADIVTRCRERPGTPWFQGHWGFQYYMEKAGVAPLDFHRQEPILRVLSASLATAGVIPFDAYQCDAGPGDLVIYPTNNANLNWGIPSGPWIYPSYYEEDVIACNWLATMDPSVGAGFYAGVWGPLPFAFGKVEPGHYRVRELATPLGKRVTR